MKETEDNSILVPTVDVKPDKHQITRAVKNIRDMDVAKAQSEGAGKAQNLPSSRTRLLIVHLLLTTLSKTTPSTDESLQQEWSLFTNSGTCRAEKHKTRKSALPDPESSEDPGQGKLVRRGRLMQRGIRTLALHLESK
ncbi:hypothetical protein H920_15068 [Fukomys damarensis]|uniref:Uncharacterized protein n=1 Tax=Fukomys damarensis TaxID=885580 RepID=A0A091DKZ7_FUKDA|nr:hypothetical protein H920_15068 [Fukomys damarensis]